MAIMDNYFGLRWPAYDDLCSRRRRRCRRRREGVGVMGGSVNHRNRTGSACSAPQLYKEHARSGRIPVVACTTEASPSITHQCFDIASDCGEHKDERTTVLP